VPLGAAGFYYFQNSRKDAELTRLRQEIAQTQKTLADLETSKATQAAAESDELARLRKDNEDLLRLRRDVQQLRGDKQQLEKQLQTAQGETQRAQGQVQAAQTQAAQAQAQFAQTQAQVQAVKQGTQGQTLTPEQQAQAAFRQRYGLAPATDEQSKATGCMSNLRQIDGAKQQWALENRKTATALASAQDLARYLPNNTMPNCPGGGAYTINTVSAPAVCTIPTHVLPR
jgi:chromosome segregation ATPase